MQKGTLRISAPGDLVIILFIFAAATGKLLFIEARKDKHCMLLLKYVIVSMGTEENNR